MNIEKIFFKTDDKAELVGLLHTNNNSKKVVISVHGMASNCLKRRDDILAKNVLENGIDYFTFNNRGHDVISYFTTFKTGTYTKEKAGTSYENVEDSYYDIKAALDEMIRHNYKEIYLQGHSLGCTKIVYAYNKFKSNNENNYLDRIKAIILLSLIDLPRVQRVYLGDNKFDELLEYAINKKEQGKDGELMPIDSFMHPMSVKTYLKCFNNSLIDFARYWDEEYEFPELNNIQVPLFMRWGDTFEMIEQKAPKLVEIVKNKISNENLDIGYIAGANHGYAEHEQELANEILEFFKNRR